MELEERREWLEEQVGRRLPDLMWNALVDNRDAKAGEMDEIEEEMLVAQARFGLRMRRRNVPDFGMSPRRFSPRYDIPFYYISPSTARPDQIRREVFTKCVAYAAEDHPAVLSFRDEVLGNSYPLTYEQALRYVDEDGHVREEAPHARRLKDLTETLAQTFLWRVDDASWFVLCALYTPPVLTFSVETNVARWERGPEIGTIRLTVEPWMPARIVLAMYKGAQRKMLGKRPHQVSKGRLRLLEFVETMTEGWSWRERMDLWNELHPGEQYEDVRNFRNAYREVRARVLELGYTPAEQDEKAAREERRRIIKRKLKIIERQLKIIRQAERAQEIVREATGESP
jgi:hypothetical protein